jgi:hypothetical protein
MNPTIAMSAVLAIFNIATIVLIRIIVRNADFKTLLAEKPIVAVPDNDPKGPHPANSYSRFAGLIGAAVMVTLFWALSNIVICLAFTDSTKIAPFASDAGQLMLYGASLFLPYAVNQLREIIGLKK